MGAAHFRFPAQLEEQFLSFMNGIRLDWDLYVRGPLYNYKSINAKTFGRMYIGYRPGNSNELDNINADVWEQLMSAGIDICPAVFCNDYGKGKAVTLPCMIDSAYMGSHRSPEQRLLVGNIIKYLLGEPIIEIERLPINTEIILNVDSVTGNIIIHLITFNGGMSALESYFFNDRKVYAPLMEEAAVYHAKLKINIPFKEIFSIVRRICKREKLQATLS